ncbi:MAG TPA: hypothetical protein VJH97_07080 [Candidatus Nanoarchaeia archaeon]|nr:hypothetical protein [Candidatus Nanoarchaeia archaeon]
MDSATLYLKEWIIQLIRNRDVVARKLVAIEDDPSFDLKVIYKDKEQYICVKPLLADMEMILSKMSPDKHYAIVTANTLGNFNLLLQFWDKMVAFRFLCLYFVNPFSNTDKKWIIYPYTHSQICDEESLKVGLRSIFDVVEPLTESDVKTKFA